MAADCEVNNCGVLAIGRCETCGLAFCKSHQSANSERMLYVNQCLPCFQKGQKTRYVTSGRADRDYITDQAADDLKAHGVPSVEVRWYDTTWEQSKIFNRKFKRIDKLVWTGEGWIMGPYECSHWDDRDNQTITQIRTIALLHDDRRPDGGLSRLQPVIEDTAGGGYRLVRIMGMTINGIDDIHGKIKALLQ